MSNATKLWVLYPAAGLLCVGFIVLSHALFPKQTEPTPVAVPAPVPTQYKAQYLSAAFEAYELRLLASFESESYPASVDESRERLVQAIGTFCTP
jgi:hypothetical protein